MIELKNLKMIRAPHVIQVPQTLPDEAIERFFRGWKWRIPKESAVELDFKSCEFLAPWALALFATYAHWLVEVHQKHVTADFDPDTLVGKYLVNSGFCKVLGDTEEEPPERLGFTVCMQRIETSGQIPEVTKSIGHLLSIDDEELNQAINYALTELLRNVIQHAHSKAGGVVMAQYFPKTGLVELVVADHGIGIRSHIAQAYPDAETDMEAINLAVLPHHSGTFGAQMYSSMKDNAGLGLFFVSEIAFRGLGRFILASGKSLLHRWGTKDARRRSSRSTTLTGGWDGTFVVVQLKRGLIGDFSGLLDLCRQIAAASRDDPYIQALEFVDEPVDGENVQIVLVEPFLENVEEAARIRDNSIIPSLRVGNLVVLDFSGIRIITQSFAHALFFQILKQNLHVRYSFQVAHCRDGVKSAILAVASYARSPDRS